MATSATFLHLLAPPGLRPKPILRPRLRRLGQEHRARGRRAPPELGRARVGALGGGDEPRGGLRAPQPERGRGGAAHLAGVRRGVPHAHPGLPREGGVRAGVPRAPLLHARDARAPRDLVGRPAPAAAPGPPGAGAPPERVDMEAAAAKGVTNVEKVEDAPQDLALERYKVFLKQYKEWVDTNRDRLEEDSYKFDQDYYPGRRKRGKDYREDMLELPFFYPGQICYGKVISIHLHQGAFVDIGGTHDGWVPIKGNDWYWIRHHIKPGMNVYVEILAKRDPYRFRFPLEMRLVYPNIDHLIFNRFDFPPIFHRKEDTNEEQLWREGGRPPIPRKKPSTDMETEPLVSDHPFVETLWEWHNAEQMILDHEDENPDKFKDVTYESTVDTSSFDEENRIQYTEGRVKETVLKKKVVNVNIKELDMKAARAEREEIKRLKAEAQERGEEYKIGKMRRNIEMDEYDLLQWRRSYEEREALLRDICCRKALGLPIEEPGRYDVDETVVYGKDYYDPSKPMYRYDYWGEPRNTEKVKLERDVERHNQQIIGDAKKWCETSYEDYVRKKTLREAAEARERRRRAQEPQEEEEYDDDMDLDFEKMTDPRAPHNRFYITK
uniref:S1 motif domain-containing protein n=1 Tax=Triticum urartu TaxID=4572 RepID=A0A8R7RCI2_TRIUA